MQKAMNMSSPLRTVSTRNEEFEECGMILKLKIQRKTRQEGFHAVALLSPEITVHSIWLPTKGKGLIYKSS